MIKFKSFNCEIQIEKYKRGGNVIVLVDTQDGSAVAFATVHVHGLGPNEVAIKNYSENDGIYDVLIQAKVIKPMHREVEQGFVMLPVCMLKKNYRCL